MDNSVDKDKKVSESQIELDTTLTVPMDEEDMNRDLNLIVQKDGESIIDFAKRAIVSAKNSENESIFKFSDGVEITSKDIELDDKFAPNMLAATYEIAKSINPKKQEENILPIDLDENLVVPRQADDIKSDPVIELDIQITNPLQFLLDATTEKYHSEEQQRKIEELQEQKKQLIKNKEELVKKLVGERDIDIQNSKLERIQNKKVKIEKIKIIDKSIRSQESEITSLETERSIKTDSEEYKNAKIEFDKIVAQIENQKSSLTRGALYAMEARKQLLGKTIASHEEYIHYIDSKIMECHEKVEALKEEKKEVEAQYREQAGNILERISSKYSTTIDENGKMVSNFDEIPDIVVMNQSIQAVENELARLQRNPEEIHAQIKEMMERGADVELVREEVSLLASTISNPQISGILEKDKESYKTTTEKIQSLEAKLHKLEETYRTNPYFKQKEMIQDREEIKLLKKGIQKDQAQVELLEAELQRYENQKQIPNLKAHLEQLQASIASNQDLLAYLVPESDEKIATEDLIERLQIQERAINRSIQELQKNGKVSNPRQTKKNLEDKKTSIRVQKAKIKELEEKDYTDIDSKKKDAERIQKLKQKISDLKEQAKYLGVHTVESLQESILNDYEKTLKNQGLTISEEEIEEIEETYEEPSKGLLSKLKKTGFKKKAVAALKSIVIAVTIMAKAMTTYAKGEIAEIDPKEIVADVTQESDSKEETVDTNTPEKVVDEYSDLENMLVSALKDYVIEPAKEDTISKEVTPKVEPIENTVQPEEGYQPGRFYAIVGNTPIAVNLSEAQNYIDQGYEVVSTYQEEDGQLGFLHLGETSEGKTR